MAVTYNSIVQKLNSFSLANAQNHEAAVGILEEFMNEIEPDIDSIYNNLSLEQKQQIQQKKSAIHQQMMNQFPRPIGGGKRRKTRAAKLRRKKQKKTRSNRKGTRRH